MISQEQRLNLVEVLKSVYGDEARHVLAEMLSKRGHESTKTLTISDYDEMLEEIRRNAASQSKSEESGFFTEPTADAVS